MATPSSPNLIEFGDSPRASTAAMPNDPFSTSQTNHIHQDDPFAPVAGGSTAAAQSSSLSPISPSLSPISPTSPPSSSTPPLTTADAAIGSRVSETLAAVKTESSPTLKISTARPAELHFFVSCMDVDGNPIQTTTRSAQNIMRGALSMLSQPSKTKSPRGKPPTEVSVEVRVTREFPLPGHDSQLLVASDCQQQQEQEAPPALLESESYWSERRKSRNPHFAVGFNVACHIAAMRDRHIQVMIMIPEEGSSSNRNAQLFGYAQTTFQELLTIATSGSFQQRMTLPVHSTVMDGATVEIRFANIHALVPQLFDGYHSIFRSFLFYPLMKEDQERSQAVAPKLALEEGAEVDFSVKIPLQLLKVCQFELTQMNDEWRARYNFNRKKNRFFEDDAEALNFGHDIFRVQVVSGRNLMLPSGSSPGVNDGQSIMRASTFSLAAGRAGIMNRLKTQAGKWGDGGSGSGGANGSGGSGSGKGTGTDSSPVSAFVVVKICDGNGSTQERIVGKTNTEYENAAPVFSMNKSVANCPHGKPSVKMHVSPVLPSRVEVSAVNQLKQFLFYRPSLARQGCELGGWLRLEVYDESYGIMSGIENELLGEVLIPLQSVRETMAVEETIVWEGEDDESTGATKKAHSVNSLTLVDWFDIRHPSNDDICGQIQLRLNILLANPAVRSAAELVGDGSHPVLSPRRQRLAADSEPPTSNPLESEMSLQFLYPHVLTLQKQIAQVNDMIRLCESLVEQKKTFKSSQHKKRADIQGIPTNLHVSYFRILRHFGQTTMEGAATRSATGDALLLPLPHSTVRRASTEDLLGLGSSQAAATTASADPTATAAIASPSPLSTLITLQDRAMIAETHATITCGAPTAHAMGLSEYGLREMELEIHRLQGILDRCNPRVVTTSREKDAQEYVGEDAAEYAFSSLQDDVLDDDDDTVAPLGLDDEPTSAASSPGSVEATPPPAPVKPRKKSTLAARAVAGAKKAAAKRRQPKHNKGNESDDNGGAGSGSEIKYPPLKTEPEDGMDPITSVSYAVRVLCRLEMLRTEYYLRKSVAVSQSVSSLVACFVAKLDLCLRERNTVVLEQLASIGFLIGWESLISSHGKELRMLSDAWVAIKCLETFAFQLVETRDGDDQDKEVVLEKRHDVGYTICVPVPSSLCAILPQKLRDGGLISITSVLFTQGINEMQSLANMVGHSGVSIQTKINTSSFRSIVEYYNKFASTGIALAESFVGAHPDEILRNLRMNVESENSSSKNTHILFHAADAVRSLSGGRVTYCKSGKDRTAMSVTLEQARLLVQRKRHVLEELMEANSGGNTSESGPLEEVKDAANVMREFGVRMEIAKKNVGRYKYSFNTIQRKLLPEIYRPPMSTIQDMVTSVTARDS